MSSYQTRSAGAGAILLTASLRGVAAGLVSLGVLYALGVDSSPAVVAAVVGAVVGSTVPTTRRRVDEDARSGPPSQAGSARQDGGSSSDML